MPHSHSKTSPELGFVADGYLRLLRRLDAEVRQEVEPRYVEPLAAAGMLRRWQLRRQIDREVARMVAERTAKVSPKSLF